MKHSYNNPVFKTLFISLAFAVGVLFQGKAQNYSTGFQGATMVTTDACSDGNINWVVNSNTALQYPTAGAEQCYAQSLFSSVPNSYCLYGTDYNFNIPSNKVITGIEVRVYGWCVRNNLANDKRIELVVGGVPTGENKASSVYYSDAYPISSQNLWRTKRYVGTFLDPCGCKQSFFWIGRAISA